MIPSPPPLSLSLLPSLFIPAYLPACPFLLPDRHPFRFLPLHLAAPPSSIFSSQIFTPWASLLVPMRDPCNNWSRPSILPTLVNKGLMLPSDYLIINQVGGSVGGRVGVGIWWVLRRGGVT
jgi:hypothetical protein